jgi:hypothetical protein
MRRKHADLIIEWAEGNTIEYKNNYGFWQVTMSPSWHDRYEYRVKPEPKPDVVKYANIYDTSGHASLEATKGMQLFGGAVARCVGVEKITLDGETGKLKSIEIVERY